MFETIFSSVVRFYYCDVRVVMCVNVFCASIFVRLLFAFSNARQASMNSSQLSASSTSKFSEGRSGSFFFVTDDGVRPGVFVCGEQW